MLQIVPVTTRTTPDTETIKYIENIKPVDSMTKKYNRAINDFILNSNEEIICFRHDDTFIRTPIDICEYKLKKLFHSKEVAVAGLIGTIALDKSCVWWQGVNDAGGRGTYALGSIIQGGKRQKIINNHLCVDNNNNPIIEDFEYLMNDFPGTHNYAATVDGCCMFFPKWFFQEGFRFDELLNSYHFYDSDICLQALAAGYKVSTVDITAMHKSQGEMPTEFNNLRIQFYNKWNGIVNGNWPISRFSKFNMSNVNIQVVNNKNESKKSKNKNN